jgi:hypothetical protein
MPPKYSSSYLYKILTTIQVNMEEFLWNKITRVSKYVTNRSKMFVMDVIGFLSVSLGSSTVQLNDSLGSRRACSCSEAGFSSQNCDRTLGVYYRRAGFSCAFLWTKGPNAKNIHKEKFPGCGGKCLSRKAAQNWVANISLLTKRLKRRCGKGWDNSQKTLCCGFRRTGKAMRQVYQSWWRLCQ